jgi:hypothetical protein
MAVPHTGQGRYFPYAYRILYALPRFPFSRSHFSISRFSFLSGCPPPSDSTFLQESFVMTHYQLRFNLLNGIHSHTNNNQ